MTKYLSAYKEYIIKCLNDKNTDFEKLLEYHSKHIEFFSHERFIHLLVTVLFAILTISCFLVIAVTEKMILVPLAVALLSLMIPYIKHYYFLENSVQTLYKYYEKIYEKINGFSLCDNDKDDKI